MLFEGVLLSYLNGIGRSKVQHKGKGKKYLTEEEIRISQEKKDREKEWKVQSPSLAMSTAL